MLSDTSEKQWFPLPTSFSGGLWLGGMGEAVPLAKLSRAWRGLGPPIGMEGPEEQLSQPVTGSGFFPVASITVVRGFPDR